VTKRREAVGEAPVPQPGRAPATPSRSSGRVAFSAPSGGGRLAGPRRRRRQRRRDRWRHRRAGPLRRPL